MITEFTDNDRVTIEVSPEGIAHVRMVRADKLNALDDAMIDSLIHAGQALAGMPQVRCAVLSGEGRAFCAGLDLGAMQGLLAAGGPHLTTRTHGNANRFQQAALVWRKLPVPVIAAIHGACIGGGLQVAAGADIRVTAPDARLAVMEMKWGLVPDMGGFALWRGIVREDVLRELTYSHRELTGSEAAALGLATRVAGDPLAEAMRMAAGIAACNPHAVRASKALFNRAGDLPLDDVLMEESLAQQQLLGSRNQIEAVSAQMERRAPDFADP